MQAEYAHLRSHYISELEALIRKKPLQKLGYTILESRVANKGDVIGILEPEDDDAYNKGSIEATINRVLEYHMSNIGFTGNFSVKYYSCKELKECERLEMLDFIRIKHLERNPDNTVDSMAFLHAFQSTVLEREVSRNSASSASYTSKTPRL